MDYEIEFKKDIEIIKNALKAYGVEAQMVVAIEEMSELTYNLAKFLRDGCIAEHIERAEEGKYPNTLERKYCITEEIADVQIMLWQLAEFVGKDRVNSMIEYKLQNLASNLEDVVID